MYYEPYDKIYCCARCDSELAKKRGCKRDKRKPIVRFDCVCEGDKKCTICKGIRSFTIKYCPLRVFNECGMNEFITNFFIWKSSDSTIHPAGGSRLFQPVKMLEAFTICKIAAMRREEKIAKSPSGEK